MGDWKPYDGPCPNCGGTEFLETSVQDSIVNYDEDNDTLEFVPQDQKDTESVWCRECDEKIYEEG